MACKLSGIMYQSVSRLLLQNHVGANIPTTPMTKIDKNKQTILTPEGQREGILVVTGQDMCSLLQVHYSNFFFSQCIARL